MKKILIPLSLAFAALVPVLIAQAATYQFTPQAETAVATTTLAYITPGTATTTITYDAFAKMNGGQTYRLDAASLLVQFTASSTASSLAINEEFSQDGIDWYQGSQTIVDNSSTTTLPVNIQTVPQYVWPFASSTPGKGAVLGTNNMDSRLIQVNTPTRYTRFIFTVTGASAGVWAEVLPIRQKQS